MNDNTLPVAREGLPFIALFAFVTLVFALLDWGFLAFIALVLTLFTVYFFRDPERYCSAENGDVIAPADGKVVFVGEVMEERFFKEEVQKVSIFMSVFDVHVNRAPCSGKVVDTYYNKGEFLNASLDKASLENEQSGIFMQTENDKNILFVQVAGLIARRIISYPKTGDIIKRCNRYGLIRFGSRVDIYLPKSAELSVHLGDRTVAGETVVGNLQ
ncbi:MAG: phosphatidylserine decarboxylase family protein [Desulfuromonas sp.]|nr:MAG: phosphatidylserine decarboxylase family protein [Desulfuromonas sp.]